MHLVSSTSIDRFVVDTDDPQKKEEFQKLLREKIKEKAERK